MLPLEQFYASFVLSKRPACALKHNQLLNGSGSGFYIQLSLEYYDFFQGSGLVVVIDATEWEYETHMRHAKDRMVCVTYIFTCFFLIPQF